MPQDGDITNGDVKKELMGTVLTDVIIKLTMCYQQSFDSDAIFFSQKDNSFRFGIIKYQPPK